MKDKELKLWVVTYHFHPVWAGPAERFLRYTPGFRDRGIETKFVTVMRPGLEESEEYRGAEVQRIGNSEQTDDLRLFIKKATQLASVERPDIFLVLVADPLDYGLIRGLRKHGVSSILLNTMVQNKSKSGFFLKRIISNFYNTKYLKSFDKIVCSTDFLADKIRSFGVAKSSLKIISNGVNTDRFRPVESDAEKKSMREKLGLPPDEFIFLFVGLREDRKGVLELLSAWKHYKTNGGGGSLVLVGDEQREKDHNRTFFEKYDELVGSLKGHDLHIHGPSPEIESYIRSSDSFVFLSKKEGMPNVIPESMACGLPLMTTRFEGFSSSFGQHMEEIIITERKDAEVAGYMKQISEDPDLYNKMSGNALKWIREHHEVGRSLDAYRKLFEELADE